MAEIYDTFLSKVWLRKSEVAGEGTKQAKFAAGMIKKLMIIFPFAEKQPDDDDSRFSWWRVFFVPFICLGGDRATFRV